MFVLKTLFFSRLTSTLLLPAPDPTTSDDFLSDGPACCLGDLRQYHHHHNQNQNQYLHQHHPPLDPPSRDAFLPGSRARRWCPFEHLIIIIIIFFAGDVFCWYYVFLPVLLVAALSEAGLVGYSPSRRLQKPRCYRLILIADRHIWFSSLEVGTSVEQVRTSVCF